LNVLWNKAWFDLWQHKGRSLVVILSLAAGLFIVGGIFGMIDQLLSGMDRAHQAVSPAQANIILRNPVDQAIVDDLATLAGVEEIDPINQVSVRYKVFADDPWSIGTLVERPNYDNQKLDVIELKEGAYPEDDMLAVERLTSAYFGIDMDNLVIFNVNGEQLFYPIAGKIRHPFVQPPLFGGQAHFFANAASLEKFGIPAGNFLQLLVRTDSDQPERVRQIAADVRSRLAEKGVGVVVVLFQDAEKHWGRSFVEGITVVLGVMALASLALSALLVLTTMTALITQQVDQIGIIKSIGGQRRHVAQVYLFEVLILALLGLLIALPSSAYFAFYMTRYFLNFFNIDYTSFVVSYRAVAITIAAGVLVPLLAGLLPVIQGSRISVRAALASYGLGGDFKSGRLERSIEHLAGKFLPTVYAAALGNLFRRKNRLALTMLVLIVAGVMFLVVMSLVSSITLTLDQEEARQNYDVRLGFTRDHQVETITELALGLEKVADFETWYSRNAAISRQGERIEETAGLGAQLIGIPLESTMIAPLIAEGRWFQEGDAQVIVMPEETARKNDIQPGDRLNIDLGELGSQAWEVIGTYRSVYGGGLRIEAIYAPLAAVQSATGQDGIATQLVVRGDGINSLAEETSLADELESTFEDQGINLDFYTTQAKRQQRSFADNQFSTIVSMLLSLAVLIGVVGGIGLMGSLLISVVERTREIGVLRSIGAQAKAIHSLFIMEGLFQGLFSFVIAVPLAFLLARPLADLLGQTMIDMNLSYQFNLPAVGIWLGIVVLISVLASLLPARSAGQISVRDSLAYA
jgi:putative ABC transport system permease protein